MGVNAAAVQFCCGILGILAHIGDDELSGLDCDDPLIEDLEHQRKCGTRQVSQLWPVHRSSSQVIHRSLNLVDLDNNGLELCEAFILQYVGIWEVVIFHTQLSAI